MGSLDMAVLSYELESAAMDVVEVMRTATTPVTTAQHFVGEAMRDADVPRLVLWTLVVEALTTK